MPELDAVNAALERSPSLLLTVGFNRRFAPQVRRIADLLSVVSAPKAFVMTVNAGAIPATHWTQDHQEGGGRIIGEACHFIDLLRHLAHAPIVGFHATSMNGTESSAGDDKASITLRFGDGSFGTILYLANGHKSFPKERLEVFCGGAILQLDNFRKLSSFGWPGFTGLNLWRQDKGQRQLASAFVKAVAESGPPPIPIAELIEVARVTIQVADTLR